MGLYSVLKDFVAIAALSVLAQVIWAFIGTVVTVKTGMDTMKWAMIGICTCPTPVAILYLRLQKRTWRESLLIGLVLGLLTSAAKYVLLMIGMAQVG